MNFKSETSTHYKGSHPVPAKALQMKEGDAFLYFPTDDSDLKTVVNGIKRIRSNRDRTIACWKQGDGSLLIIKSVKLGSILKPTVMKKLESRFWKIARTDVEEQNVVAKSVHRQGRKTNEEFTEIVAMPFGKSIVKTFDSVEAMDKFAGSARQCLRNAGASASFRRDLPTATLTVTRTDPQKEAQKKKIREEERRAKALRPKKNYMTKAKLSQPSTISFHPIEDSGVKVTLSFTSVEHMKSVLSRAGIGG